MLLPNPNPMLQRLPGPASWREIRMRILIHSLCALLLFLAAPSLSAQDAAAPNSTGTVTNEAGDALHPGPQVIPTRLWKNFTVLFTELVEPFVIVIAKLVGLALLAGIAGFFVGGLLGFLLWYVLRRYGWLDAPYSWYRYFKWMWAFLFPICAALGLAYAAAWLEAGHVAKGALTKDRLVERTVASVYAAVALDAAKHEISGRETMAEVQQILHQADELSQVLSTNFGTLLQQSFAAPEVQKALGLQDNAWLKGLAASRLGQIAFDQAAKSEDARLVLFAFYAIASGDKAKAEYLQNNPKAGPAVVLARDFLQRVNRELVSLINWLVYPQAGVALLAGFGVPLLLAALFRLVAGLARKNARPPVAAS